MFPNLETNQNTIHFQGHSLHVLDLRGHPSFLQNSNYIANNNPASPYIHSTQVQATSVFSPPIYTLQDQSIIPSPYTVQNTSLRESQFTFDNLVKSFFEGVKFVGTTLAIFAVFFFLSNYESYTKIADRWYKDNIRPVAADETIDLPTKEILVPNENISVNMDLQTEKIERIDMEILPTDFRLAYPRLDINVPIIEDPKNQEFLNKEDWVGLEKNTQTDLQKGVVHYPSTAFPGTVGNLFLTGHSSYYPWDKGRYKTVFAVLPSAIVGDQIVVFSQGKKFIYKVIDIKTVSPEQTDVLDQPTDKYYISLMTCVPVGTAKSRLVVIGEQIYPSTSENKKIPVQNTQTIQKSVSL